MTQITHLSLLIHAAMIVIAICANDLEARLVRGSKTYRRRMRLLLGLLGRLAAAEILRK